MTSLKLNMHNSDDAEVDDAQWRAMQYVLGELTDEQAELFESAMSEDIALCETVLTVTELFTGVALACESHRSDITTTVRVTSVESQITPDRPVFARFSVFVAAASMVLAVLFMINVVAPSRQGAIASPDNSVADALALLLSSDRSSDTNSDFDEFMESDDSISSLDVPEWLLTAVDLDAAATLENQQENASDNESGVY